MIVKVLFHNRAVGLEHHGNCHTFPGSMISHTTIKNYILEKQDPQRAARGRRVSLGRSKFGRSSCFSHVQVNSRWNLCKWSINKFWSFPPLADSTVLPSVPYHFVESGGKQSSALRTEPAYLLQLQCSEGRWKRQNLRVDHLRPQGIFRLSGLWTMDW